MGWVGVGALVATTCFILYRYIPSKCQATATQSDPSSALQHRRESVGSHKTAESKKKETEDAFGRDLTGAHRCQEADDRQTTPKAQAVTTPSLVVPTLSLNGAGDTHTDNCNNGSVSARASLQTSDGVVGKFNSEAASPTDAARTSALMPPPPAPRQRPTTTTMTTTTTAKRQQQQQRMPIPTGTSSLPYPPRFPPTTSSSNHALRPPPSAAASLRVPQANPNSSNSSSNSSSNTGSRLSSSTLAPVQVTYKPSNNKSSRKVILEPGFSPLDWAALTSNPHNRLRGSNVPPTLVRVTPSMLKAQNGRKGNDAWTSYMGKVYNITPYLPFHPGGKGELLRGAGKDSGTLFMEVHPWVNWDAILGECLVGILVSEGEGENNRLDEMD